MMISSGVAIAKPVRRWCSDASRCRLGSLRRYAGGGVGHCS
ncbi:hypothetical protein [Acetobacterium wieringae]|nr:hypothetical protein [Acetobacterium wieringae]